MPQGFEPLGHLLLIELSVCLIGPMKIIKTDHKHQHQRSDGQLLHAGNLGNNRNQQRSRYRCTLTANIVNDKIFAALLWGYDFCKIRTGKRLNGTLKHPDGHR